jgi:alkylhydroperoxidase family enzyme
MAWIEKIEPDRAKGPLKEIYDDAVRRAGRVFEIVKLQSLRPDILKVWLEYYKVVMFGPSDLTRVEREMVATVVSRTNGCHY